MADNNSPEVRRAQKRWQDIYKAEKYLALADKHVNGEANLSDSQIKTLSLILDRVAPRLSAVEQSSVSDWDNMGEEELKSMVRALITAHPELIREFAPGPTDKTAQNEPQGPTGDQAT